MNITLYKPKKIVSQTIDLLGSKSISNRVLIIKALSGLHFTIDNLSNSDDTIHLANALKSTNSSAIINVGHAGTDLRFLTAFLCLQNGAFEITGSNRLKQRPIKNLVNALKQLGAEITYKDKEDFAPLIINGKPIIGGEITINGSVSSQFITALLLVAPYFKNGLGLTIEGEIVSKPYINMTIELMKEFGANVYWIDDKISVKPVAYTYKKTNYLVESDWSAASYFYSIVAQAPINTTLQLKGLFKNSLQADAVCQLLYKNCGIETFFVDDKMAITKKTNVNTTNIFNYDFIDCPDIAQTLVCTYIGLDIAFNFTGLQTLKVKETDRILALQTELKKIGYVITITNDCIAWKKNKTTPNNILIVNTYNDHRMAMSFAPLCMLLNKIIIEDAEVVSKSYPLFWEHLKQIGFTIN